MFRRSLIVASGLLATAALCFSTHAEEPPLANGVEILARGPVHEGYATAIDPNPVASPIIPKQPPEAIEELPPDQKPEGDNVVWLPGYWSWDQEREDFIWVSGFWRVPPPNRFWVPGSWRKMEGGWQWTCGFWNAAQAQQAEIEYLPEPPASLDEGPSIPATSEASIYVPGNWVWRSRYVWQPGCWIDYRPGWIWIPAHYRWTPAGYVCIDGYWDYPLADRGMLFAPVYIPRHVYIAPSYCWRPSIVVRDDCMYGSLFVRRGWGCYYFGDYFDRRYATLGYTSWTGYRGGPNLLSVRGWYDPMLSYYRVSQRNDPFWRGGINDLYAGRFRGEIAAPPRTLGQQITMMNRAPVGNDNIVINNRQTPVNSFMLSSMGNVAQSRNVRLQTLNPEARQEHARGARQLQDVGRQRNQMETQLKGNPTPPRASNIPRVAKLDVPKMPINRSATINVNPTRNDMMNPALRPGSTLPNPQRMATPNSALRSGTNDPNLPKVDVPNPATRSGTMNPQPNLNQPLGSRIQTNPQAPIQPGRDPRSITAPPRFDPPASTPRMQSPPNANSPGAPRAATVNPAGNNQTPPQINQAPRVAPAPVQVNRPTPQINRTPQISQTPRAAPSAPRISPPNKAPKASAPRAPSSSPAKPSGKPKGKG